MKNNKYKYLFIQEDLVTYIVTRELTIDDLSNCNDGYIVIVDLLNDTELVDSQWIPVITEDDIYKKDEV